MSKKPQAVRRPASKKPVSKTLTARAPAKPNVGNAPKPEAPAARKFSHEVVVPAPTPEQAKARAVAVVVQDKQSRTALELRRDGNEVIYVPNESDRPYRVERLSALAFDQRYQAVPDYPVGRAARLLVGYAIHSGGTSDVMAELAKLVHVTEQERDMAQAKAVTTQKPSASTGKPVGGAKPKAAAGPKKERGPSASSRFKELIMTGKMTDDEIFRTVQKEFGLGDDKRNYVAWYRNYLRKQGQNPPAPKGGEAAKKAAPAGAKPGAKKTKAA